MQAEILSDDELADLTGYKHRAHQRKWLKDRNWVYIESRGGHPLLIEDIMARNSQHNSQHFILSRTGMRVSQQMLRNRWDDAREAARSLAASEGRVDDAEKIQQFQFKDIRPKAASEITDIADASLLLGHSEQEITKRVYRRIGAVAQPSK